jgi:hypothetical protein
MHNGWGSIAVLHSSPILRGSFLLLALMGWSFSAAPQLGQPAVQVQTPSKAASEEPFPADERLEIPAIHSTLRVAEPNEIPVVIHGSGLKAILSDQRIAGADAMDPYGMEGGDQTPELLHHADGSTCIKIVPIRLGKLTIRLTATFADHGIADQSVSVDVGPSKVAPAALGLLPGLLPNGLFIDRTQPSPSYLSPVAYYYGLKAPIPIPVQFVTFDAGTAGNPPVVQIDPATGKVTPLRTGDALLETRYAGAAMHTCIQVRDAPYSADVANRDYCKQLRRLDELAASTPLSQTWPADPGRIFSFFSANANFFADRISVVAPDRPAGLGQPVQIPVRLFSDRVRYIFFRQWIYNNGRDITIPSNARGANGALLSANDLVPVGESRVSPLKDGGETGKFIQIVPLALGNLEVGIGVYFEDGGLAERFFRMKVVPSSQGLESFRGYEPEILQVPEEPERRRSAPLMAEVTYKGIQDPIRLNSLEGVSFTIRQPPGPPVIEVDEKGWVRALHAGDAVVVADFAGIKWEYPLHVLDGQHLSSSNH